MRKRKKAGMTEEERSERRMVEGEVTEIEGGRGRMGL